ncbi:MAG: potassium/proton antiporter [Succinatimonas sp.]|nr:potassium/proton antiporter [Succinatimonas sp.]
MENTDLYYLVFIGGLLLTCSIFASKLSKIVGTPLLLLFLGIGMLCGEDGIFLHIVYNDYTSAFYIANLMLALILFDGGLRTNFHEFRSVAKESLLLATFGVVLTSFITGAAAYLVLDLTFVQALLVGSIVGSTDAAAVFMLLGDGGVHLKQQVSSTLKIESATNDPMAILLTTVLLALISGKAKSGFDVVIFFLQQFGYGLVFGIVFGMVSRVMIASFTLGAGLYSLLAIGMGLIGYAVTSSLGGSGCLAIFIMGMCVGNQKNRAVSYVLPVGEGITWLAQITLFLMLGILVTPHLMVYYLVPGIVVAAAISFIARPLSVFLLLKPFFKSFSNRDLGFMSWVGLRGSVPVVLAIYPVMEDVRNAQLYFNVAFVVVLFSLLVQGASLVPASKWFKVYALSASAPLSKSEMGIMLSDDYELFNYKVRRFNLEGVRLGQLRMPRRTCFAGVFRDGFLLKPRGNLTLKSGDIISIIGSDSDESMLNALFAQKAKVKLPRPFKGNRVVKGEIRMTELSDLYGLELTSFEKTLNVSEFMSYHIGGFPQVGDSVSLINSTLVVSSIEGDEVSEIGVMLARDGRQNPA